MRHLAFLLAMATRSAPSGAQAQEHADVRFVAQHCHCAWDGCISDVDDTGLKVTQIHPALAAALVPTGMVECLRLCAGLRECVAAQIDQDALLATRDSSPGPACELYGVANAANSSFWASFPNASTPDGTEQIPRACAAHPCCFVKGDAASTMPGTSGRGDFAGVGRGVVKPSPNPPKSSSEPSFTSMLIISWAVLTAMMGVALICRASAGENSEPRSWRVSRDAGSTAATAARRRRIDRLETSTYSARRGPRAAEPPHTAHASPAPQGSSSLNRAGGAGGQIRTGSQGDDSRAGRVVASATIGPAAHTASPQPTPVAAPAAGIRSRNPTRWLSVLGAYVRARFAHSFPAQIASRPEGPDASAATSASHPAIRQPEKTSSQEQVSACAASSTGGGECEDLDPPVQETQDEDEQEECVLCISPYEEGDIIRHLPCRHYYHAMCVDTWLEGGPNRTCPLCKADPFATAALLV